ncbi:MAG: hypothetical protein ABJA90_07840 [Ginsengibacter sp.]
MIKQLTIILFVALLMSCSAVKKVNTGGEASLENRLPPCLQTIIHDMAAETNGSPQSVTRYSYKQQTVYYLVSPCCDKYNIVYDSACHILGYPDGGLTGKGDSKMINFKDEASDEKLVWSKDDTGKLPN